ncbi:hypothetical protein SBP02_00740 [Pseudomonas benzenivorans]|uniref:Lipoprotein n=1 Tax=Pseudomonas benzenivorans TaxID=556533 RepID=A0ABZ0PVU7_9PSED|nr:hypothetical protein [Pseudomonas benzenivorans]WPC05307.1 hypothetical protein SBP02_00740 [Pseudomonas benzenivorans]
MRPASFALLGLCLLAGCASQPQDPDGTWINQAAIDAASRGGPLRDALLAYGPNLEWRLDSQRRRASYSNGYEQDEGQLLAETEARLRVDFYGDYQEFLAFDGDELVQAASGTWPEQRFVRAPAAGAAHVPPGGHFERALYQAYLGGTWRIAEGLGAGGLVLFHSDGRVEGLPGAERYALCLAGDCAAMSGESDSLWLQLGEQGQAWLFERDGERLGIFAALNRAQANEMPDYHKGPRRWLLQRD